jgi:quercetin dioxygenase-like cupin family protein
MVVREHIRTQICAAEDLFNSNGYIDDSSAYEIKHYFSDGVYARELTIPVGHVVVGKIHRHEHLNFLSKGRVTVLTEEGGKEELSAPCTLISPKGVKRLLYTHEETVWTVVHITSETDLDKIEKEVIAKDYTEMGWTDPKTNIGRIV